MAIALSCPSCDHELKVKDELAGRRIKCPKCGSAIAVLDKEDEVQARTALKKNRKARADEDDEPEEDERPRKKKKKKAKSNKKLVIGSVIGVLVLIIVLVLILMRGGPEKEKVVQKKEDPAPVNPQPPPDQPPEIIKKAPVGGIARSMERTEIENALRQLGIAYRNFEVEQNRGPRDQKELGPYYQNVSRINEALTNKWIVFIWGVNRSGFPDGASNTILAHEGDADRQNNRFVLFGDGSVHTMDEDTFKKTPKAKGK